MDETLNILKKINALLDGHFVLSSGLHSQNYFQMALVFQYPEYGNIIGKKIADKFRDEKIDIVIGPALGGIIIAYEVAKHLNAKTMFSERHDNVMTIRRGFNINKGDRVLIVEDVITTAKSMKEVIPLVEEAGGIIAGGACIVNRSESDPGLNFPVKSILEIKVKNYKPEECPLCKEGIPAVKPGSRK